MDQRSPPPWQPREDGVSEICALLQESKRPNADQARVFEQLQHCSQVPDFSNYLVFILCRGEGQPVIVRQSAGLLLKNNLKASYKRLPVVYQQYIKTELLSGLGSPNRELRATVGIVISVVIQEAQLETWPELFQRILECLETNEYNHMEGALDTLFKIAEDAAEQLDQVVPGLAQKPSDVFIPRLLKFFSSSHVTLKKLALGTLNHFINIMPQALFVNMDSYLQGLFALSTDPSPEIRKLVCAALVRLLEVEAEILRPHMKNVIEYMLLANNDQDPEVALGSCEFWSAFCEAHLNMDLLRDALPRLIGVLLTNMAYADDDEALLDAQDDDNVPDSDQNLKPRFHQSRLHGNENEDEDEDSDDIDSSWNLRKCSAAGLDNLSTMIGDDLLPLLMPLVEARLANTSDEKWKDREAAVLALGAVAQGCINGLLPHLPQIVAFLIPLLDDKYPLVRGITCWTLSRYSKWIIQAASQPAGVAHFDSVLTGLLRQVIGSNKQVQEAACSAFATLEEEAAEEDLLQRHLEVILQHLMFAFSKYQRRNLRMLYDAIGTLADAVGGDLNDPKYLTILMPPLIAKWQQLSDNDKDLFPLLECFTSIAQALGSGFGQYAEPIFARCIRVIRTQEVAKADPARAGVQYDKEFIVCSLDLLSGLAEGLGTNMESLVVRSDLRDLLLYCCGDEAPEVRQSALALLGDLAKACAGHLQPRLGDFLNLAARQLDVENVSVSNNACWAIGEIAIKVGKEIAPIVVGVISCLVPILSSVEKVNKSMLENSAITLGRLGWVCPELAAPHIDHFMKIWCHSLAMVRDDIEKEDAFRGLCAMVRVNPGGSAKYFGSICEAIASWHEIRSAELRTEITQILHGFKQMLGASWDQYFSYLDPATQEKLKRRYSL